MGCSSCAQKRAEADLKKKEENVVSAEVSMDKKTRQSKSKVVSKSDTESPIQIQADSNSCMNMYPEIVSLDSKAIKLHNHVRLNDTELAGFLLRSNKELRIMMLNLKNGCPDQEVYLNLKNVIESEYTKYFSKQ